MNSKKIIFIISFLVLFGFLFNLDLPRAKAQTTEELLAQIQQLQNQILLLQKQLADIQAAPSEWCHDFSVNLRIGDSGAEVTALQTALSKEGLYTGAVTGTFDEYTASAVVAFQEKYASEILTPLRLIHGTGFVGSATRTRLDKIYGCAVTIPITPTTCTDSDGGKNYYIKGTVTDSGKTYTDYCYGAFSVKEYFCLGSSSVGLGGVAEEVYVCPNQQSCKEGVCVSTTTSYLIISDVTGIKSIYNPGEKISFTIKAMESDGTVASAGEGFNIQSYIYDTKRTKTYDGVNGVYNSTTGLWNVTLTAPSDLSIVAYDLEIALYCSTEQGSCAQKYGAGPTGGGQVEKWYQFTLTGATQPSITVISPNGGESWKVNSTQTILWKSSGIPSTNSVKIVARYYIDSIPYGSNYKDYVLKEVTPNDGSEILSLAGLPVGVYVLQIKTSYNSIVYDDWSDSYFKIVEIAICTDSDGGKNYYIKGTVTDSGKTYTDYCYGAFSVKEYFCLDVSSIGLGGVAEEVYVCPNQQSCKDGVCFQAVTPYITVISPNGGEIWGTGKTYNITWKASDLTKISGTTEKVNIELTSGTTGWHIAYNVDAYLGTYSWTVPSTQPIGSNYKISIWDAGNVSVKDSSDNYFNIVTAEPLGFLSVSLSPDTPSSANLVSGQTNITFARIKLTAGTTSVNNMNAIQIGSDSVNASNYLTNIKVFDGNTQLDGTVSDLIYNGSYYYQWIYVSGVSIPAYSSKVLSIVSDIKSTATNSGSVRLGIAGLNFTSPGANVSGLPVYGYNMTINPSATTCTDSDGGKNYYTKGYITVNGIKSEDECNPGPNTTANTLLEYYCTGNNSEPGLGVTYICSNGCENGACKQVTPTITVVSPNGGETLQEGSQYAIKWNALNLPNDAKIHIQLFTSDGGRSMQIVSNLPATQRTYTWLVTLSGDWGLGYEYKPSLFAKILGIKEVEAAGIGYQIMVSATWGTYGTNYSGSVYDKSDNSFAIAVAVLTPSITSISPTSGAANDMITIYGKNLINTDPSGNTNPSGIYIEFLRNGVQTGTINGPIYTQPDGLSLKFQLSGIFVANTQVGTYQIRAVNANGQSNLVDFTILGPSPSITVTSPNGGEKWTFGTPQTITWNSTNINSVVIYLWFPDGGTCKLADNVSATLGRYTVTIQENQQCSNIPRTIIAGQYKIGVWSVEPDMEIAAPHDYSDNYFSIVSATPPEEMLVSGYDFYVKTSDTGTGNWNYAKSSCEALGNGWSLPTMAQLRVLYQKKNEIGGFQDQAYWSSESGKYIHFSNGFENTMNIAMTFPAFRCVKAVGGMGLENIENQLADISKAISALIEEMNNLLLR